MNDTFYIVYKLTNTVNDKIYIGAHVTKNINDEYMGSGHALSRAKKKHGIENFIKEILHVFDTEQQMWDKEYEIVNEAFCKRKDTYNLRTGGIGGWNHWNGSDAHKEASNVVIESKIGEAKIGSMDAMSDLLCSTSCFLIWWKSTNAC